MSGKTGTITSVKPAISLPEPSSIGRGLSHASFGPLAAGLLPRQSTDPSSVAERRSLVEAISRANEEDLRTAEEKEPLQGIREKQRKPLESDR